MQPASVMTHKTTTVLISALFIVSCGGPEPRRVDETRASKEPADAKAAVAQREPFLVEAGTPIQPVLDAASAAGGGTVVLSGGTFDIDRSLRIDHESVRLVGQGRATVLRAGRKLDPMIYVGAADGPLYPYSGNSVEHLLIDLNHTNSTGILWRRWGQIGFARDLHFVNPGVSSVGIATASNKAVNELVFEGINWWNDPRERNYHTTTAGTAIRINANNCKVLNSTFIGADIALDVGPDNAISQFVVSGCRLKENNVGIRIGGGARRGGYSANVSDSRFEKNRAWDLHIGGRNRSHRWDGIFLRGLFFSNSTGVFLANTRGVTLETIVVKDFTAESTRGRGVFVTDGSAESGSNERFHARNVISSSGTKLKSMFSSSLQRHP